MSTKGFICHEVRSDLVYEYSYRNNNGNRSTLVIIISNNNKNGGKLKVMHIRAFNGFPISVYFYSTFIKKKMQ